MRSFQTSVIMISALAETKISKLGERWEKLSGDLFSNIVKNGNHKLACTITLWFPCLDGLIQTRVSTNQSTRYIHVIL